MSAKKKVAGSRPVPVELKAPLTTQSAATRRAAETELRALITKYAPSRLRLFGTLRRWLQKRLPTAHEIVYEYRDFFVISYSPNEHGYEGILGIRASESGIKLYFNHGNELPDPAKLLQGTGKQVRSIDVDAASTLARPEVLSLIDESIAGNDIPFAPDGHGSVIIRPTSAKQRRPSKHGD